MRIDGELAAAILKRAAARGADHAEVFLRSRSRLTVEVKERRVDSLSSSHSAGFGLRVLQGDRMGFSASTDSAEIDDVVERALSGARFSDPDPSQVIPQPMQAQEVSIFDPAVESITEEDAIGCCGEIERSAYDADSRVTRVRKPTVAFSAAETIIANSNGIFVSFRSTACSGQITAIAGADSDAQTGWAYQAGRRVSDLDFAGIGTEAGQNAARMLGARKAGSGRAAVVLDRSVVTDFLGVFASMLSAEAVQKGKSLLAGKTGRQVLGSGIDMVDSGLVPWCIGSRPVDDEGVPVQDKILISSGVLQSYLHNSSTARRAETDSTGNAVRGSHASLPAVGITNFMIRPADNGSTVGRNRLFHDAGQGVFVTDAMGMHTINPVSGDFSIGVSGFTIEDGEIGHPVKEAVIAGNLLDLFGRVAAMADDFRWYGSAGAPSLLIHDVDISS